MRKLALALVVAFGLGGCAHVQAVLQGAQYATVSVENPITQDHLYQIENAAIVVFAGLNAYKKSCELGAVEKYCRQNIARIQVYTRQIPPYLDQLRKFVKENDQVNAIKVYGEVKKLFDNAKATANALGVQVGG